MTVREVEEIVVQSCRVENYQGKRVLLIVPDGTRTAPIGLVFRALHQHLDRVVTALDVLVALGTHQPMSESAICARLEITPEERQGRFRTVRFFNHQWDNPEALRRVGELTAAEIRELTGGRFEMDVPVEVNRLVFDYDQVIIIGPVFPHEVVGFSGGNKYLFPGVSGPQILNFFHWLGAVVTNPMIIGNKWTPVRKVVDRAAAMVNVPRHCFCLVVSPDKQLAGMFSGTPEAAWDRASELSRKLHILRKPRPYHTIISCAPPMYDELWTAGKCMYKLEPVLADGGELVIYAPHLEEICVTHGAHLREIGYHCRDYFLEQWDRFKDRPWGVLAHSTHVRGVGTYVRGIESCRAKVTLASRIPEQLCRQVNLGYRDPGRVRLDDFAGREDEGILLVRNAGEFLYQLENPPCWAGGQ